MESGNRRAPPPGGVGATAIRKALPELPQPVLHEEEDRFDEDQGAHRLPWPSIHDDERLAATTTQDGPAKEQSVKTRPTRRNV